MTDEELKLSYYQLNGEFFSGILPDMPVSFKDTNSIYGLGAFECCLKETKMPFSISMIEGTGSIELCSSTREEDWLGVLLHEMVHAYFAVVGLGRENHGPRFHAKCERIEAELGHPIPRNWKT